MFTELHVGSDCTTFLFLSTYAGTSSRGQEARVVFMLFHSLALLFSLLPKVPIIASCIDSSDAGEGCQLGNGLI